MVGVLGLTTTPAAAAMSLSWTRPVKVSPNVTLKGVTCQSPSLCVAYGNGGRLFVSSHPSGGAATWKVRHIDGSVPLKSVSCPSASLCAAYDANGNVIVSAHPLRGASSWRRAAVDRDLDSLTCPSSSLCIGFDSVGNVVTSTAPARAGSWRTRSVGDTSPTYECVHYQQPNDCAEMLLSDGSCASPHLCVALDQAGNVVLSTDPAADPSPWSVAYAETPDSPSGLKVVSCTSAHFCFGTDNWGNFLGSVNPAAGQSAWTATGLNTAGAENHPDAAPAQIFEDAACSSSSACIATSARGRLFASADPAARVPRWSPSRLDGVSSITCPGSGWCFAVDSRGRVHAAHDPTRAHSWRRAFNDPDATARFSCPSARLCVAVDDAGRVATGTRAQRRR